MIGWLFIGLILAALLFAFLGWWSRTDEKTARNSLFWAIVVICLALGGLLLATGKGIMAVVPAGVAAWRMLGDKTRHGRAEGSRKSENVATGTMTEEEALDILGLEKGASDSEVKEAYKRLMGQVHPDKGGNDWMASKLNEARQTLMKK